MKRYLKLLEPAIVYWQHDRSAMQLKKLDAGTIVPYNREKRRNGINWMEIYLANDEHGYIEKTATNLCLCEKVKLTDANCSGFDYVLKTPEQHSIDTVFGPLGTFDREKYPVEIIEVSCTADQPDRKKKYVTLEYRPDLVTVTPVTFNKGDIFYITFQPLSRKEIFMDVDNLNGKKGLLLKKTNTGSLQDGWVQPLAIGIMIVTIVGIFMAFLSTGWIVIGTAMIIPAAIIALVVIVAVQIAILILKEIVHQIRKRF